MPKLQFFRVFLNKRLTAVATEIFGAAEKTVVDYREENDQLRRMLEIKPKTEPCKKEPLQFSEEEVPPHQKHCEQEWSPSLQQEDPEPRLIKEEEEELRTSQEEEPLQGLFDTKDSILTPLCVKIECDLEDPLSRETPAEYPSVSGLKMSKLQSFHVFLNERLMVSAAVEIFRAVEKTVSEYQEENDHLRRLLKDTQEMQSSTIDSLQVSGFKEEVPQEWSPSLGEENPEPTQIKEEQEEAQLQRFLGTDDCILTPPCVNTHNVENRGSDSKPMDLKPLQSVSHLKGLDIPCKPPDNKNKVSRHSSVLIRDPVGLDSSLPLDQNPPMGEPHPKLTITSGTHHCRACGETFPLKDDVQSHMTLTRKRSSEFNYCNKCRNSSHKLKAPGRVEKPCPICGKTFKYQGDLSKHMTIHTEEKPFSCGDCGKKFSKERYLKRHKLTHLGKKPFSCSDCGKRFSSQVYLRRHKVTHSGDKQFSCDDCGKKFRHEVYLKSHKLAHTGEKPYRCGDCGKRFSFEVYLRKHKLMHTAEKPFSCGECGKKFRYEIYLGRHILTHTGEKPFSCCDCGKSFSQKGGLNRHIMIHTGEKPFSCGYCGRRFMLNADLRKHKLIHRQDKSLI